MTQTPVQCGGKQRQRFLKREPPPSAMPPIVPRPVKPAPLNEGFAMGALADAVQVPGTHDAASAVSGGLGGSGSLDAASAVSSWPERGRCVSDGAASAVSPGNAAALPAGQSRRDAPTVGLYARGSKRLALDIAGDRAILAKQVERLEAKTYANSSMAVVEMKLATWCQVARAAGHEDPFKQCKSVIMDTIAALWGAHYRSIDTYASIAKQKMIERDGSLWDSTRLHFVRALRAAKRGQGPPKQASALPVERFGELPGAADAWASDGPLWPRRLNILAAWWMLREIEAANLTVSCATFTGTEATLRLPASKTDQTGLGTARTLACTCKAGRDLLCPWHTLKEQVVWASGRAKEVKTALTSFPLFPSASGQVVTKVAAAATIVQAAQTLGLVTHEDTGAAKFSGHSWRVSGAQFLARSGIDIWRIQLHGRWGSAAVLGYVKLAALHASLAVEATLNRDLSHVREAIVAAKVRLAQLTDAPQPGNQATQNVIESELGESLVRGTGVLGPPCMSDLLDGVGSKHAVQRQPWDAEVLVHNFAGDRKAHALRPPQVLPVHLREAEVREEKIDSYLAKIAVLQQITWCGWQFGECNTAQLVVLHKHVDDYNLCQRCFGKAVATVSSSSDVESD